jgi:flagellar protein FlbD
VSAPRRPFPWWNGRRSCVRRLTRLKADGERADTKRDEVRDVIILTRLDGHRVAVNEDLLVFAEQTPDTVLTMSSGQRLMVKETLPDIVERIAAFRRQSTVPVLSGDVHHG